MDTKKTPQPKVHHNDLKEQMRPLKKTLSEFLRPMESILRDMVLANSPIFEKVEDIEQTAQEERVPMMMLLMDEVEDMNVEPERKMVLVAMMAWYQSLTAEERKKMHTMF